MTGEAFQFAFWKIESLKRSGTLYQIKQFMRLRRLKLLFLSETRNIMRTYIFPKKFVSFSLAALLETETHGVGIIVHRDLIPSVLAVRAISPEIILFN